jgi:hypothetical protein
MAETGNSYGVLMGKPEGKRPIGRPRHSWDYNFTYGLAGKCNKDQLKKYPPENGLVKWPKHVVVNKQRN